MQALTGVKTQFLVDYPDPGPRENTGKFGKSSTQRSVSKLVFGDMWGYVFEDSLEDFSYSAHLENQEY